MSTDYKVTPKAGAVLDGSYKVSEDCSAKAGRAMQRDAGGTISVADANDDLPVGLLVETANSETDSEATVCKQGVCPGKVGTGGWDEGDALTAESGGALIATTTAGHQCYGYAAEAGAAGDFADVDVQPFIYPATS